MRRGHGVHWDESISATTARALEILRTPQFLRPIRQESLYKTSMKFAPAPRIGVPAGTAAAIVIATSPSTDPLLDSRRYARFAALPAPEMHAAFEALVASGVYVILERRILVLRILQAGTRAIAAIVSVEDTQPARPGIHPITQPISITDPSGALGTLLDFSTKQRPVFHGSTPDGITLSGFEADDEPALIAALETLFPVQLRQPGVWAVFAGIEAIVPAGLVLEL